jgi:hypothetical protein
MAAAAQSKIPMGMSMMLKSLGVDPQVIMQVAGAVGEIAATLQRIEANQKILFEGQKKLMALIAPDNGHGK